MIDEQLQKVLSNFDSRLSEIEKNLGIKPKDLNLNSESSQPVEIESELTSQTQKSSNILGFVGAGCLILATVLLIKFSIDSGWLNPMRQIVLSALFGFLLVILPFFHFSQKKYFSLLPAAGVVVLHLAIYGGVFYHKIIGPEWGIAFTALIGAISLWLLSIYREDNYAVLAIAGTYIGCILLKNAFSSIFYLSFYLLLWDIAFSYFSIILNKRSLITFAAYFSLGFISFISLSISHFEDTQNAQIAILQFGQMAVYTFFSARFSFANKSPLTESESWQLFPIYLFFYGHEFHILNNINPLYAVIFALIFSIVILGTYFKAKKKISISHLDSAPAVFTLISIIVYHSVFFDSLKILGQLIFGLLIIAGYKFFQKYMQGKEFNGVKLVSLGMLGYILLTLYVGSFDLSSNQLAIFGFIYGGISLFGLLKMKELNHDNIPILLILIANSQIMLAISRLSGLIGTFPIVPLWILYAFITLFIALKMSDKILAKAAFPIIFIAIGRFLIRDFAILSQGQSILSLLFMGGLIFVSGFLYSKVKDK
jgi:hypothetical protein